MDNIHDNILFSPDIHVPSTVHPKLLQKIFGLSSLKENLGLQSMTDGFEDYWDLKFYFLNKRHVGVRIKGKCELCGCSLTEAKPNSGKNDPLKDKKKVKNDSEAVIRLRKHGRMGKLKYSDVSGSKETTIKFRMNQKSRIDRVKELQMDNRLSWEDMTEKQ